jgi:TetR/AcrR family transcriptional regulator
MNKQLISYYFGGKQGLYAALSELWQEAETGFATGDSALEDLVAGYVEASLRDRDYSRMVGWKGLMLHKSDADQSLRRSRMQAAVQHVRRRQEVGELDSDLEPAFVLLALFAASGVGAILPQVVRNITGLDPHSVEFTDRYAGQLRRVVRRLA